MSKNEERERFIDSSFDEGDSLLNRSSDVDRFIGLENITPSLGKLVGPGEGGFRLADTPQGWVFIQKKEWMDDTWTYVVSNPQITISSGGELKVVDLSSLISELDTAQAELTRIRQRMATDLSPDRQRQLTIDTQNKQSQIIQLQQDLSAAQQVAANTGVNSQVKGKVVQIDIRNALGNIITRKLDWVSDHEKFTKATASFQQSTEATQLQKIRPSTTQNVLQRIDEEITKIDQSIRILEAANKNLNQQVEALQSLSFVVEDAINDINTYAGGGSSLAQIVGILQAQIARIQNVSGVVAELLQQTLTFIQQNAPLNPASALALNAKVRQLQAIKSGVDQQAQGATNSIQTNQQRINDLTARRVVITEQARQDPGQGDTAFNLDTAKLYAPTTFSGNAYTRYYKFPAFKTQSTAEVQALQAQLTQTVAQLAKESDALVQQTRTGQTGAEERLLQKRLEYATTRQQLDRITTQLQARQLDAPIAIEVGQAQFNGVMELANVSQITTSVNIEGEGSANLVIENPQNVFFISLDDIDLALQDDPFLESTRTLPGKVYYRGHFYSPQIVDLLLRRKGYTSGLLNTKEELSAQLANQIGDTQQQIRDLQAEMVASIYMQATDVQQFTSKIASLQADLIEFQRQQQALNNSSYSGVVQQVAQDKTTSSPETQAKEANMNLIRQTLLKYYAGKAIIQVLDRVYIWMTSPTRTIAQLSRQGNRFGLEDPSSVVMGRQIPALEERLSSLVSEKSRLINYFKTNSNELTTGTEQDLADPKVTSTLSPSSEGLVQLFTINPLFTSFAEGSSDLTFDQAIIYNNKIFSEIALVQQTIDIVEKQINSTDALTGSRTFDKLPFSRSLGKNSQQQRQIVGDYDSRYLGIEQERLQVFQGVVSMVKQTYSDGKYQLQVTCRDNLVFLSMSRIMIKPALRADQGPRAILQDPIWRGNELAGNWKNGISVLDFAFINDEVRSKMDRNIKIDANIQQNLIKRKVLSETEAKEGGVVPFVTSLPFARIDAANLVSFIITGFPYSLELFIKNAAFGGRLALPRLDGITDQQSDKFSFFTFLKRRIGELNDRLGDFEPFIDLKGDQFDPEVLKKKQGDLDRALSNAKEDLIVVYQNYIYDRMQRFLLRVVQHTVSKRSTDLDVVEQGLKPLLDPTVVATQVAVAQSFAKEGVQSFFLENGKQIQIVELLLNVIVRSALQGDVKPEPNQVAKIIGTQIGTESDFEAIANAIINAPTEQVGPFQVAAGLVRNQAASLQSSTSLGEVRSGASQATNPATASPTEGDRLNSVLVDALVPFVKALLVIQTPFSQEYVVASTAAANKADLDRIVGTPEKPGPLMDYITNIKSQSTSIQGDVKDGAQSTLEKIIRGEKKNFLIISDQYSLDFDLQAYQTELSKDFALWQSEWEAPLSVCRRAADQVDFEFYADENGNLQFKPPTYNRILKEHFPLISQMDRTVRDAVLIRYGGTDGQLLQAMTRAVSVLYQAKVEFSTKKVAAQNDLTRSKAEQKKHGIPTQGDVGGKSTNPTTQQLQTLTDAEITATYNRAQSSAVQLIKDGASIIDRNSWHPLTADNEVEQQAQTIIRQLHLFEDMVLTSIETDTQILYSQSRISQASGDKNQSSAQLQHFQQELQNAQEHPEQPHRSVVEIQNDIIKTNSAIADAQSRINQHSYTIDQQKFGVRVDLYINLNNHIDYLITQANQTREKLRDKAKTFVDGLERFMDENRIHRIADYDLINYDITEAPPRFTYLEVTGSPELVQITPSEYYWAGGVDYDNWRQYGYLSEHLNRAYFHSGDQARTYVRAMLGRERGRVMSGSISVRGDSKFRVGDCVFIESMGMYFYILGVSHSLSYPGSYTSNMTLAYGRRIGELIPYPFDALGKIMIETYQNDVEELLARQQDAALKNNQSNKQT